MTSDTQVLEIGGLRVELKRRNVKSARLGVRSDGTIRLSAPYRVSRSQLVAFVEQHRVWLVEQVALQRSRQMPVEDCSHGGRVLLWGRWHEVVRKLGSRATAVVRDANVVITAPDDDRAALAVGRMRRREIEAAVCHMVPDLQERVGEEAAGFRYRAMTSRWGTCNVQTRQITVNTWLVQRPVEQLEYVLLHELAHLVERGHGPRFTAVMDRVLPQWPLVRDQLQAHLPPRS